MPTLFPNSYSLLQKREREPPLLPASPQPLAFPRRGNSPCSANSPPLVSLLQPPPREPRGGCEPQSAPLHTPTQNSPQDSRAQQTFRCAPPPSRAISPHSGFLLPPPPPSLLPPPP